MVPSKIFLRVFSFVSLLLLLTTSNYKSTILIQYVEATTATFQTGSIDNAEQVYRFCTDAASTSPKFCYKTFFGSFYYDCDSTVTPNVVRSYSCSNSSCLNCVSSANFTPATQVVSTADGGRMLNWTGIIYSNAGGVIMDETFDTSKSTSDFPVLCNGTFLRSRNFYPAGTDNICFPWMAGKSDSTSQKMVCATSGATTTITNTRYMNSPNCVNGTATASAIAFFGLLNISSVQIAQNVMTSGDCSDDGSDKQTCMTTTGANLVVFWRSSASGLMSTLLMVMMMLIVCVQIIFVI